MAPSIPRSRLGHLTRAAVATIALAAALLATSPVAAQSVSSSSVAAIERRMAELANQSRAAVGARPVAVDVKFAAASRDWSCQMARTKNFAHDPNFAAALAKFAEKVNAKLMITGHESQDEGFLVSNERHLIVASDHNRGVFVPLNLSDEPTMDVVRSRIKRFVAVELPE